MLYKEIIQDTKQFQRENNSYKADHDSIIRENIHLYSKNSNRGAITSANNIKIKKKADLKLNSINIQNINLLPVIYRLILGNIC